MKSEENYAGNPINALTLILSLTEELENIKYYLNSNDDTALLLSPEGIRFPLQEDLEGAAVALWRLQKMYNLNVTSLAAGKLIGTYRKSAFCSFTGALTLPVVLNTNIVFTTYSNFSHGNQLYEETTSPMSVNALFEIGRVVYNAGVYETSLQWFHEALRKYYRRDPEDLYLHDDTYMIDYIRNAYHGIRDFKNAIKWTEKLMKLMPERTDLLDSMIYYKEELKNNSTKTDACAIENPLTMESAVSVTSELKEDVRHDYYPGLCRGEIALSENKKKHLHCYFKRGPNPFLRLAPFKTELMHREPDVYLIYDTITDDEIKHIRLMTEPVLERATVASEENQGVSSHRISKLAWLYDVDSPVVARVSRRVAAFADLNVDTAEPLQVSNYGIGGHYHPHYDFFNTSSPPTHRFIDINGNRIATIMFYMSEVEQGGATVFTELQLTVFPVKNAAIMWTNLLRSGEPDFRTRHAACPVLRGSKWVSNKWIHELGQELIKPCGLEYEENSDIGESTIFNYEVHV